MKQNELFNFTEVEITYKSHPEKRSFPIVKSSDDVYAVLKDVYDADQIEHIGCFFILLINRENRIIGVKKISEGGLTSTIVDPRVVFQTALKANATAIILSHNHPSGNTKPSPEDIKMTSKISEGGRLLEIAVLDHIIMTAETYYSFADEGMI